MRKLWIIILSIILSTWATVSAAAQAQAPEEGENLGPSGSQADESGQALLKNFKGKIAQFRLSPFFQRSIGVRPVCLAILLNMRGPISSPSWKANS